MYGGDVSHSPASLPFVHVRVRVVVPPPLPRVCSLLLDGHYGKSGSFNAARHVLDRGLGRGSAAYVKPVGFTPHAGTVYTLVGSSAKVRLRLSMLAAHKRHSALAT